jgi:hypothetical protein
MDHQRPRAAAAAARGSLIAFSGAHACAHAIALEGRPPAPSSARRGRSSAHRGQGIALAWVSRGSIRGES